MHLSACLKPAILFDVLCELDNFPLRFSHPELPAVAKTVSMTEAADD